MTPPIAVWRVVARFIAVPDVVRGTDSRTTEGGRDKRPGARGVYGVVVVDVFARLANDGSAVYTAYLLFLRHFCRADRLQRGRTA